jgi:hypothetical protein
MPVLQYNRTIRLLLKDLADLKSESHPAELCCLWFDDFYFPGQLRPPGYAVNVWERGQREWKDCFSVHELQVLAEFHAVFFAELNKLPTTAKWQQDRVGKGSAKRPILRYGTFESLKYIQLSGSLPDHALHGSNPSALPVNGR